MCDEKLGCLAFFCCCYGISAGYLGIHHVELKEMGYMP